MNAKKKSHFDADELVLLPLGGTGEIGMNCYCYGSGPANAREWLMVDLGVKFGDRGHLAMKLIKKLSYWPIR